MDPLEKVKFKLANYFEVKLDKKVAIPQRVFSHNGRFYLCFKEKNTDEKYEVMAASSDGFSFKTLLYKAPSKKIPKQFVKASIVENYSWEGKQVLFFGDRDIKIAWLEDKESWVSQPKPVITHAAPVEVGAVFVQRDSIVLLYFEKKIEKEKLNYSAYLAFFDKNYPQTLLFKTPKPVWRQEDLWPKQKVKPLGSLIVNGQLVSYWYKEKQGICGVIINGLLDYSKEMSKNVLKLAKHLNNPIIQPEKEHEWEAFNTFNPAAVYLDNSVHVLYRAQGFDYISSIGYARSKNGYKIDERLSKPVFTPNESFEDNKKGSVNYEYISGGGYGGCEDPRVTRLGNKIYMVYVAFDGWQPPRLAMTSILIKDFLKQRWLWSKPILISPPGVVDKSGCLLPEKINGKYVFFHRIFPNILIDFVDDLIFDGKSKWLKGQYSIKVRPDKWDSRKIGVGAPPLKTKDGWLLIYYGVDDRDDSKYHIGAMLLDLKNPTKVLYRTDKPILEPTQDYELTGFKPGIAYPCGAVIINNKLMVYYGGADSVVCVATAELDTFLRQLKNRRPVQLYKVEVKPIDY
jgi:beta-1,2-mannobiose phosphorylase / 1,2-beta-oligomannan phosphorylase